MPSRASALVGADLDDVSDVCRTSREHIEEQAFTRLDQAVKQKPRGKFDIITANLFSELLIAALPNWRPRLTADGRLILCWSLPETPPGPPKLALLPAAGGSVRFLDISIDPDNHHPHWSPDGESVTLTTARAGAWNLESLPLSG